MDRINFEKFVKIVGKGYGELFNNDGVKPLSEADVLEIKVGKSFYYQLKNDSYLKPIHNNLNDNFLKLIPTNNAAVAYKEGMSYLDLFEPHRGSYYFLRLDIKSFFHSISEKLLAECFSSYFDKSSINKDVKQSVLDGFVQLVSYTVPENSQNIEYVGKRILPIGFSTSPLISNIIFRKLDLMIQKLCMSKNITYTRYADDMLFSSVKSFNYVHSEGFYKEISILLSTFSFRLNRHKTVKATHTISLNGYTIENTNSIKNEGVIRISNKKTKVVESLIYKLSKGFTCRSILEQGFNFKVNEKTFKYYPPTHEYLEQYCNSQILNKLTGYRSYLISILKYDSFYSCVDKVAINKYLGLIKKLDKQISKVDSLMS